jgi:multisubunit Na+/H+ antiporter MnhE subunit
MDVLNTTGGGVDVSAVVIAAGFGILAIVWVASSFAERSLGEFVLGVAFAATAVAVLTNAFPPVRHEVTLRPGYVIDAAKYEIIEQRGLIYVIEEREAND